MKIYEQIIVDITNPYPLPKMQAQQGNIGRGAKIKLVHNGALIELDKEVVNLYARLPESTEAVYLSTTVANGVITADFTNVMLSKPGAVQVEIQIIENDVEGGSQITTPIFVVEVNPSNINTGEIIASSEFNALVEALAEVQEYKANGLKGDKGDKGDAATIQVGTVETLEPNQNATVSNSGTATDAVFNFGIPKGAKGEPGAIQTVNGQAPDASGNVTIETASSSYTDLTDKPSINGTELTGNKTLVATINGTSPSSNGAIIIDTVPTDADNIAANTIDISNIKSKMTMLTCMLGTAWTEDTTNGYYTQSITVSGITSSDYPILDVQTSGTLENINTLQTEWAKIVQAETGTNTIVFYAKEATTTNLPILVKR